MEQVDTLIITLNDRREALGMTGEEFARHLGISMQMWSVLRRGEQRPGRRTLAQIARVYPDLRDALVASLFFESNSKVVV